MWMRIKTNYEKCEYFPAFCDDLEKWLMSPVSSLASFNIAFIEMICNILKISPEFKKSSDFPALHERSERVLDLLHACNSTRYYCARGAFSYMYEDKIFPVPDIEVLFQDFQQQPYPQRGSPNVFVPYLSVLDALLNIGPEKTRTHIQNGTRTWLSWQDMVNHHHE